MNLAQCRILLADDDHGIRDTVAMLLRLDGSEVFVAADGREALAVALREKPDVVLVDHLMPKLTGIEVFLELRRLEIDTPVIMMTAADEAYTAAPTLGVNHVLEKPFTAADLEAAITKVLEAHRARDVTQVTGTVASAD